LAENVIRLAALGRKNSIHTAARKAKRQALELQRSSRSWKPAGPLKSLSATIWAQSR